jgi:holliday junction DNA helicase RuvB
MTIKTSKKHNWKERIISWKEKIVDTKNEIQLRPKFLNDYIWQENLKKHLKIAIDSAKIRNKSLEHVLLYWPPWIWKTTLSLIISNEMNVNLKHTSWPAIEKQSDIISILTSIQQWDILFIDEIHRLKTQIEEILYSAMEDFTVDIIVWSGTWATSIKMELPKFTLVWATTKLSKLSWPLRDRFWNILKLDYYEEDNLSQIAKRSFKILDCIINNEDIFKIIAQKSRWTPRIVNRFVKIIRDYKTVWHDIESISWINEIFKSLWIDELWLDNLDNKILKHLIKSFNWKPVWLNTLASLVWEEEDTIEEVVEPYLLKIGFLERTTRGRQITDAGIKHIKKFDL